MKNIISAALGTIIIGLPFQGQAAPGTLAQQPLFQETAVPANIFFLNDDSGSMEWEVLIRDLSDQGRLSLEDSFEPTYPVIHNNGCSYTSATNNLRARYSFVLETANTANCNVAAEEEWRIRTAPTKDSISTPFFNAMYYNPARYNPAEGKGYKPWLGKDNAGNPYGNMAIDNALLDPYNPGAGSINLLTDSAVLVNGARTYYSSTAWQNWCASKSIALSNCVGWRYYTWDDANNNNVFDTGEETLHWVRDLSPAQQTDFANWFSYHRSRNHAAKYALSVAINEASNARLGYGTINSANNRIRIGNTDAAHRDNVLSNLFQTQTSGSTPLRNNLKNVGIYYETGTFFGTSGTSPILSETEGGACQLNNAILMTDGFYNGNTSPNVGNADADDANNDFDGAPYADGVSNTLADVAMHFYKRDLAAGTTGQARSLPNDVPTSPEDSATHQHMNTYTVAFGMKGDIDPTTVDINAQGFTWPNPTALDSAKIDDLFHAAVNGRGQYLNASNPEKLVEALTAIVRNINSRTFSPTAIATSSFKLTAQSQAFVTQFDPATWTGELVAYEVDANGSFNRDANGNPIASWRTNNTLASAADVSAREIITYNGSAGIPFRWDTTKLSSSQQTQITQAQLNYLRGNEDSNFRTRSQILGDIVNSSPVHVSEPSLSFPDTAPFGETGNRYSDFWNTNKNRTPVVYFGANDGMLHGFRADKLTSDVNGNTVVAANAGKEILAYVPEAVFPNLGNLTNPNYQHQYFVDLTPTVADAFFSPKNLGTKDWHTVLIGGLGAGGKALFALDITDPSTFSEANASSIALWEFNSVDDADLGYTLAKPSVGLTKDSSGNARWAVFSGNGYNSDNGIAKLFIIFLDANASDGWDLGTDYLEISTATGDSVDKNGLSSPTAVDSDGDGYIDRVYAGDLEGNLWVFNQDSNNSWGLTYSNALFKAVDGAGTAQPITAQPSVIRNTFIPTSDNNKPNLLIYFGTGQYLTQLDLGNTDLQSFYGVWDSGTGGLSRAANLTEQDIILEETGQTATADDVAVSIEARLTTDNYVPYDDSNDAKRFGWAFDLIDPANLKTGERVVSQPVVIDGIVFFTTYIPSSNVCTSGGGESWLMSVKAENGGFPQQPVISINGDTSVDDKDVVLFSNSDKVAPSGIKIEGTLGAPTFTSTSLLVNPNDKDSGNGQPDGISHNLGGSSGGKRISWRELRPE